MKTPENNKSYTLRFKSRGARFDDAKCTVALLGIAELGPAKISRKMRGVDIQRNERRQEDLVEQTFTPAATWTSHEKKFTISFPGKELKALPAPTQVVLKFKAYLAPFDRVCDICDVELVPAK